jgi:DNA polymerase I-like protein with 3'-5' exonuclease and polymerase domains
VLLSALRFKGKRTRIALAVCLREKRYIETTPKITEESLDTVSGTIGHLVKRRVMLSHRRSLVLGLVSKIRTDGKLGAGCNPCATPTFRANYRVVVNIPRGTSLYGKDCRSLFIADNKDHMMVGSDAAGLEARMLCHYMDDVDYTDLLLNGDIHTFNQELAGLDTRDQAKTFLYALLYGAGDANLGAQVGGGKAHGALMRARFMNGLPKYAELVERTKLQAASGYITGLDGRPIRMRRGADGNVQLHKALNTQLQSAGAVVMKYGMIFLDHWVTEAKLEAHQVIWSHDEVQYSVHKRDVEEFKHYANHYVRVAGEFLGMNIPLASDAMAGRSWFDTH